MNESDTSNCKQDTNTRQMRSNGRPEATFSDSFTALIKALADFSSELKVEPAVLSISADASRIDVQSLQPSHVHACLRRHIAVLQAVSVDLKTLADRETQAQAEQREASTSIATEVASSSGAEAMLVDSSLPVPGAQCQANEQTQSTPTKSKTDDHFVQIRAPKAEIDRRISAFIERKQHEINESNVREFCNVIDCNQENSCARTDAVFTPYPGFKSHVKVTRVLNPYGPQGRSGGGLELRGLHQGGVHRNCGNPAIEERLHNMEAHLKLPTAGPVPLSVYQRLKKLEDRILELEGLSPEYFQSVSYAHKRPKASGSQPYSLSELDEKINAVRSALLKKVNEYQHSETPDFAF
ncbi:MAP3K12-binding inhibitory protein 1 [Engraulis encrasicolus]|uniref:MAP3K12-binding inhibitory protein 1 n=1 Tax=Engraulis encrasicolus TaxID=184585 RepID=UPI002FD031F2